MFGQQSVNEFNNSLPVEVEVLEQIDYIRYLLKLGRKELTTKSYKQLDIGYKYLAQLSNTADGTISLSNMKKYPDLIQSDLYIKVEFEILKSILLNPRPISFFKKSIIDGLRQTNSKDEFNFLVKLLLSLEQKILTIPFVLANRSNIFQVKHEYLNNNDYIIDFYITFNTLGELSGTLEYLNREFLLTINTMFKSVKIVFEQNSLYLKNFKYIKINLVEQVKPLYQLDENLINLEG
jgi:hypothetical protein